MTVAARRQTAGQADPLANLLLVSVENPTRIVSITTREGTTMSALPVYQVEFIPLERRLGDRRIAPAGSALPAGLEKDRRKLTVCGRRAEDPATVPLKLV
jgi:hypothetical protein